MNEIKVIGQMDNSLDHSFESANRVYDKEGLCPTIPTGVGGGHMPKILTRQIKRELQAKVTENGIRIYQNNEKQTTASEFRTFQKMDAVCNSIMSAVPSYIMQDEPPKDPDGSTKPLIGVDKDDVVPESEEKRFYRQAMETTERCKTRYRIRKLTPRECGRLMGVKDSDIDKMAAVNSNSQLYKQFGNSIVVDVMCAMFRKLNIRGVERYV